jgi:hypothetical protein
MTESSRASGTSIATNSWARLAALGSSEARLWIGPLALRGIRSGASPAQSDNAVSWTTTLAADVRLRIPANLADFELWSSFPSDQATYFFAFATGFWFFSVRLAFVMAYSAVIIVSRVYLGTHFPSDVLTGAVLGVAVQLALNRELSRSAVTPVLALEKSRPAIFNALLFSSCLRWGRDS